VQLEEATRSVSQFMEIRKVLALRGPNIWANFPVLEAWVDLKELEESPSDVIPGFNDRVMSWLPTMIEHRCSEGVRGGFFERLRRGTWMGHILEHLSLELQCLAGTPVTYGKCRGAGSPGIYHVIYSYDEERVGRMASEIALNLLIGFMLPFVDNRGHVGGLLTGLAMGWFLHDEVLAEPDGAITQSTVALGAVCAILLGWALAGVAGLA